MNLKQLSEVLNLSPTTVSRALNGYPEVNADTKRRVIEAARLHGYTPNTQARRLATGRTMGIGHVIPLTEHDVINPIFADFIAGAGEAYARAGYNMVLSVTPADKELETYRTLHSSHTVDGVILHGPRVEDPRLEVLQELGMPFVVHGRMMDTEGHSWMDIRNEEAFFEATSRLTDLGHRRIALLNGTTDFTFALRRQTGFTKAMEAAGLEADPDLILGSDMNEPFGYSGTKELLARSDRPTAILTSSLATALGVNRALTEAGLALGKDMSVITHDDALSFLPNGGETPLFASTKSPLRPAGLRCGEMIIDLIEGRVAGPITELWDVPFIEGASLGAPA